MSGEFSIDCNQAAVTVLHHLDMGNNQPQIRMCVCDYGQIGVAPHQKVRVLSDVLGQLAAS